MAVIELLESDDDLTPEQKTLEEHEAFVDDLVSHFNQLIAADPGIKTGMPDP